ncbi:MAG: TIGR04076 family protein [Candidatus Bathyarchaeia archaeon]
MVERSKVRITVLKTLEPGEVFGEELPIATDIREACGLFTPGQEFVVGEDGRMPEGFCTWAWNDIYGVFTHLRFGGDFPWVKEEGAVIACCTDGLRPVIFKLQRI